MPLRNRQPIAPQQRRRLVRAALVVAAVTVLVALPAYLSSLPGFFGRYPALAAQYEPWSTSPHLGVSCEGCHVPPQPLDRAAYRTRMVGEFYLSIAAGSRDPELFPTPTNDACLSCHSELRSSSPKGDLQIPHRAHITILAMQCVQCHNYLVHELNPAGKLSPTMDGCLTCHDGDTAKDACTACHTQKAAPESHAGSAWLIEHAEQADDPACVTCHKWKADWCVDCHRNRPLSHGSDWRAVHRDAVGVRRTCEACHTAEQCARCHGDVPELNFDPTLTLVQ